MFKYDSKVREGSHSPKSPIRIRSFYVQQKWRALFGINVIVVILRAMDLAYERNLTLSIK